MTEHALILCREPGRQLGPGTGLGVAHLVQVDGKWQALPGEGGHVDFAPKKRFTDFTKGRQVTDLLITDNTQGTLEYVFIWYVLKRFGILFCSTIQCQLWKFSI